MGGGGAGDIIGGALGGPLTGALGLASAIGGGKGMMSPGGSELEIKQLPGVFGASAESGRLARALEGRLMSPEAFGAPYSAALQEAIFKPSFAPTTESEKALLGDIASMTQGSMAARGLGPATAASLGQTLAPTLVNMRQQRISNLMQALGGEREAGLMGRGQTLQGLLELAGLAMPQVITGQKQTGPGLGYGLVSGLAQGLPAALMACWVAEVLYGEDDIKTHLARHYATNNDTLFLRAYKKHGKKWASFLKKHTWMQPIVRPVWDYMAWKGALMIQEVR